MPLFCCVDRTSIRGHSPLKHEKNRTHSHPPTRTGAVASMAFARSSVVSPPVNALTRRYRQLGDVLRPRLPREFFPKKMYEQEERFQYLSEGSFGQVFLTKIEDTTFAVKTLETEEDDPKALATIARENPISCWLPPHPNIVLAHTEIPYEEISGATKMALMMEYYPDSKELISHIQSGEEPQFYLPLKVENSLPKDLLKERVENIKTAFKDLVLAIHHFDTHRIAHRDIKPANILVVPHSTGFRLVLVDLGFARDYTTISGLPPACDLSSEERDPRSRRYSFCGTHLFMAPEILATKVKEKLRYNPRRSDMWSLGAVLYVLVTGRNPIRNQKTADVLHSLDLTNMLREKLRDLIFPPQLPHDIERLIRALMSKKPSDRPTIDQLLQDPFFQ